MEMSEWMDEWNILKIEEIQIDLQDRTPDIFQKFENIWPDLLLNTLKWIINWTIKWIPQDNDKASYCKKIEKIDGKIDFQNENALIIYNKFRAYYIWPWIYTFYDWKKFDILDCDWVDIFLEETDIWSAMEFSIPEYWLFWAIWIHCESWILVLKKVKLEWKKEMSIKDFVNGNREFFKWKF
jgi:methionyl-tRNA formyltransferase